VNDLPRHELHVIPGSDVIEHESCRDCVCRPTAEPYNRADGTIGWVYAHHPLQRREPTTS